LIDKSRIFRVCTLKILCGNSPVKLQEPRHKDVKFLKSAKNSGTGEESLFLSSRITERKGRFARVESIGPERLQFDKLNTLKLGNPDDIAFPQSYPCADIFTPSR
jgi:hypothetical protein